MEKIFKSKIKVAILLYLGLRGGCSGRRLSQILRTAPTPLFKALRQLVKSHIVHQIENPSLYTLNSHFPFYEEILNMIQKEAIRQKKFVSRFLPSVKKEREIDPLSIYQFLEMRGKNLNKEKFSDLLRNRYG